MIRRAVASIFLLLSGALTINAQSEARKALNADPRYQKAHELFDRISRENHLGSQHPPGAFEALAALSLTDAASDALLDALRKEAKECVKDCAVKQGEYEEFARETEAWRSTITEAPWGKQLLDMLRTIRETDWSHPLATLNKLPAEPTPEQWQQIEIQIMRNRASAHCVALYNPPNRLPFLSAAERREIALDPQKLYAFSKPWNDRLAACQAQINAHVLYAQHRLTVGRCLAAHDADKLRHSRVPAQAEAAQKDFDQCMNEQDIITAFCTQDSYIRYWVEQRKEPRQTPTNPARACPGLDVARDSRQLMEVRDLASNLAAMATLEKAAGGATPATMGVDVTIPAPVDAIPRFGEPVNSLGVPVGAKITVITQEPIDLLHTDAARRYRAQLEAPAEFRSRHYLATGTEVYLRAYRKDSGQPKTVSVMIDADYAVVDGRKHPLPGGVGLRLIQLANAFGGPPVTPQETVIPPGTRLQGSVVALLTPLAEDPATANSPFLQAVPFPTEDPRVTHSVPPAETGVLAPGSGHRLVPGGLAVPAASKLALITAEPIDLTDSDETRRFRARTFEPVIHQGDTLIPVGADVFLKVSRKAQNAAFYQVALAVDYVLIDGHQIPVTTSQIMRAVRIEQAAPSPRGKGPARRAPSGVASELPAQTRLLFYTIAPQAR